MGPSGVVPPSEIPNVHRASTIADRSYLGARNRGGEINTLPPPDATARRVGIWPLR